MYSHRHISFRRKLGNLDKKVFHTFIARIDKVKIQDNGIKAIMLRKVRCNGKKKASHVWLRIGESFSYLNLVEGTYIRFKSRIYMYSKNSQYNNTGRVVNYGLRNPIHMEVLSEDEYMRIINRTK